MSDLGQAQGNEFAVGAWSPLFDRITVKKGWASKGKV